MLLIFSFFVLAFLIPMGPCVSLPRRLVLTWSNSNIHTSYMSVYLGKEAKMDFTMTLGLDLSYLDDLQPSIECDWTAWAIEPPCLWSCFPWPAGGAASSTYSYYTCCSCWACQALILLWMVVSNNGSNWWSIMSVDTNRFHCWGKFLLSEMTTRTGFAVLGCWIHS